MQKQEKTILTTEEFLTNENCYSDDFQDWIACYDVAAVKAMQYYATQQVTLATISMQKRIGELEFALKNMVDVFDDGENDKICIIEAKSILSRPHREKE